MARRSSWPAQGKAPVLLVPLDGSPDAASALALALRLARAAGGTITALYVSKPGVLTRRRALSPRPLGEFAEAQPEEGDEARLALLPAGVWGHAAGVRVQELAARGDPAEAILAAAEAAEAALLAMGTHGITGRSGGAVLGSVARAVFTRSSRPTLVVPPHAVHDPDALARDVGREAEALPIGPKVIAALDGGPSSEEVAREAVELARRTNGSVRFFSGAPLWQGADMAPLLEGAQAAAGAAGVPFKVDTGAPDALEGLVALSNQDAGSIVVLGTRAAPGHTHDRLGSFTDRLMARIACPVLVLRLSAA